MAKSGSDVRQDVRVPDPPLPEDSGLSLEEYLEMQKAICHPTSYHIVRTLVVNDDLSSTELLSAVDVEPANFHYHLAKLVDAGIVDKRARPTTDAEGFYTYYRPTALGEGLLKHGVEELMQRERDYDETYS